MAIQGSTRILGFDEVGAFQYPIDDDLCPTSISSSLDKEICMYTHWDAYIVGPIMAYST